MGVGVGILKRELAYDLNAAAFNWALSDETNKETGVAQLLSDLYFYFTTTTSKIITIAFEITVDTVVYTVYTFTKNLPSKQGWLWQPNLKLPGNFNIRIHVGKTSSACSMNMVVTKR